MLSSSSAGSRSFSSFPLPWEAANTGPGVGVAMQNEKRLRLFYESHVYLSVFFTASLPWLGGVRLASISDALKQSCFWCKPLYEWEGRACRQKLSGWPKGRKYPAIPSYRTHLGYFICTKFSATSSPKAWALRPSWWCQAKTVLELWYNLCTHIHLHMLSLMLFSLVHFWCLLSVIHCQPAHCGAESNVAFLWHFNTFNLSCQKAGLWEHSSKSCIQRTRTLCGTHTLFIYFHTVEGEKALWPFWGTIILLYQIYSLATIYG